MDTKDIKYNLGRDFFSKYYKNKGSEKWLENIPLWNSI